MVPQNKANASNKLAGFAYSHVFVLTVQAQSHAFVPFFLRVTAHFRKMI